MPDAPDPMLMLMPRINSPAAFQQQLDACEQVLSWVLAPLGAIDFLALAARKSFLKASVVLNPFLDFPPL